MQSAQNVAECCNRELLRRLEVQVMKEKRFGTKMQSAQNAAECTDRELLRRLEAQVMKEKRFGAKMQSAQNAAECCNGVSGLKTTGLFKGGLAGQKCRARKMVQNAAIESF